MLNPKQQKKNDHSVQQNVWMSVSDLFASIVFVFIITLVIYAINAKEEQNNFVIAKKELKSSILTRTKILEDIKIALEKEKISATVLPREGIIRLGEDGINFLPSQATPDLDAQKNIGKISRILAKILPCYSEKKSIAITNTSLPEWCGLDYDSQVYQCENNPYAIKIETIMIEGHTDPTPVKATAYFGDNLTLSAMRAANVWKLMSQCNPELANLYNSLNEQIIGVSGYSHFRPIDPTNPADPKNRRIDIRFVMDIPQIALEHEIDKNKVKF